MNQKLYENLIQYILDHQERFYRLAYSYTGNPEDAVDVVQSAVCRALESYGGIRNPDAIKTWFYRILTNECLKLLKVRKKNAQTVELEEEDAVYHEKAYDGEAVEVELDRLEPDVQTIIRLRFFEEMPLKEIAEITGCNVNTVKSRLYRGLKQLKETMEEAALWVD